MILVSLLISLFFLVLLGFYVFVENPYNRAHQTFAAFIICLAFWTVKDIVLWEFQAPVGNAAWWASASFILSLGLQFSLVVFAWVFPENRRTPKRRAAVLFAPGIVLALAAMFGMLWHKVGFDNGKFVIDLAPLAYIFVLYVYAILFYGAFLLTQKYRRFRGTQRGQQLGAILWALGVTFLMMTAANVILPFFGNYSLLPFSATFVLPGVFIYAYAISNFKLFSINTTLDNFRLFPIIWKVALTIAIVATVSFGVFQIPIVQWSFRDGITWEAWRRYLTFSMITALVPNLLLVLLIVRFISRPIRRITLAAVQVANGAYGATVNESSNDEIGLLAESFNEMSLKMAGDIEQLKKLNEQLVQTEKLAAMGTLAAGLAHEVNNPLASISSLVQILQTKPDLDSETNEMLRLVSTQIERITNVTRSMLDFAKPRPAARTSVNIREILESSLRLASFDKIFHSLKLIKNFDESAPKINADSDQLQQVFLNLLLNARDAMPNGGELKLQTAFDNTTNEIKITLTDNGSGIAKENLGHIFNPFFTTKATGKGTGLGLAVCYGIVTAHGGRIEVAPNKPNGTTFFIYLPVNSSVVQSSNGN
ncbi:MAG: HAMP domain-containing protein [Pyrinomonadaceae bacterium]|nr:HAMP domain-containing protein [Pyrinomonadaceae bacterium]